MTEQNDTEHGEIAVVVAHGMRFVGCVVSRTLDPDRPHSIMTLSPVYELQVQMGPNGQGGVVIGHSAVPVMLLPSWDSLDVPPGAIVQMASELSPRDRATLKSAMAQAADLTNQLRLAQSGIVAPQPGPGPRGVGLPGLRKGGR
jgi:hypothetical protein